MFCLGLFVLAFLSLAQGQGPIVNAPRGPVQGIVRESSDGITTSNFLGIPYAEAPVGNRRFELPESVTPWTEVKDASTYGNTCIQDQSLGRQLVSDWVWENFLSNFTYSEDCLSLNVFVPGDMREGKENLPVMVWFYGGAFIFGQSAFRIYEGDWLANKGDVIVVTANYRLGILGFFSTGNDRIRGNAGLYDQNLVLQWVNENIASFGGNPNQVTLFGQSAGGAGVTYHDVSPLSRDYFQRVIMMSASAQDLGNRPEDYREQTEELAAVFNCSSTTDDEMLDCLKQVSVDDFLEVWILYSYLPLIDGLFVPDIMADLYDQGEFSQVPRLIGTTDAEGTLAFAAVDPDYLNEGLDEIELDIFLSFLVTFLEYENWDLVSVALLDFYFPDGDFSDYLKNVQRMSDMISDFAFESPKGVITGAAMKHDVETYMYYFTQRASYKREFAQEYGAFHSDDLPFVFGAITASGILTNNVTQAEKDFSERTMNIWLSFANAEVPYYTDVNGDRVELPRLTDANAYLDIGIAMTTDNIKDDLKSNAIYLWNTILPSIG